MAARNSKSAKAEVATVEPDEVETDAVEAAAEQSGVTGVKRAINTANFERAIDFSDGKTQVELVSEKARTRGLWPRRLAALIEGVESGKGQVGTFYKIGEFNNASGARTVIKSFEKNPSKLPGTFDMEARVLTRDGVRVSELWAAVPEEEGAGVDPGDFDWPEEADAE